MESALRIVPSALIVTVSQGVVTFDPTFMFCLICCVPPSLRSIWWVLGSLDQLYHGSNWAMMYGNIGIGILNPMFLEFLVATVYSGIQRVLAENGIDMSARDAIYPR